MECGLIREALVAFHFDEIDGATRAAVEAHLPGCPACVREFLALKRGIESSAGAPAPPASMRARVRASVVLELRARRRWRTVAPLAMATAVLLAVLAIALQHGAPAHAPRSAGSVEVDSAVPPGATLPVF